MLKPEQWPLRADLQVERKAGDLKEEGSLGEVNREGCRLCIKDLLQGQSCPSATRDSSISQALQRERERGCKERKEMQRKRPGVGQAERHREEEAV